MATRRNTKNGDFLIGAGSSVYLTGEAEMEQNILTSCLLVQGDSVVSPETGLILNASIDTWVLQLKGAIQSVDGVLSVEEVSRVSKKDLKNGALHITFYITSIYNREGKNINLIIPTYGAN